MSWHWLLPLHVWIDLCSCNRQGPFIKRKQRLPWMSVWRILTAMGHPMHHTSKHCHSIIEKKMLRQVAIENLTAKTVAVSIVLFCL